MTSRNERLKDYPITLGLPVAWGEMDAFGHVNNIIYFRYFESGRLAYFTEIGYLDHLKKSGVGPILATTQCKFRKPLSYPDTITVGARVSELSEDRFLMQYLIISQRLESAAAQGDGLIVSYDYRQQRKVSIPETIRARIEALEGQTFPRLV